MREPGNITISAGGFLLAAALVAFSRRFLDEEIALAVHRILRSGDVLSGITSDIPDLLLPTILILTGAMWVSYVRRVRTGRRDARARFYRLAGTALPAAYAAKEVLKHVFGRLETKLWLEQPADLGFHWFHGGGDYNGFPSGHMTVFSALAAACWIHFPRYRAACLAAVLTLGAALVATDYHFLSDVVAGGFLGLVVLAATVRGLEMSDGSPR